MIRRFENAPSHVRTDSVHHIVEAGLAYQTVGDLEKTREQYLRVRAMFEKKKIHTSIHVFYVALYLSDAFSDHQSWDSAWHYLGVADSFNRRYEGMSEWDKLDIFRYNRSVILERQGKTDQILKLWRNQCIGSGEDVLARALRKKFGKDRMKSEIEKAIANPKVSSAILMWSNGHRLVDHYTVLPDGDSVPGRDFGGLFVRIDLPEKSCYLWAPFDDDSITSLSAYLNNFRQTRFCKILQDIDPDAPQ
ncbi:MAG TPA: hypothetical protein PKO15_11850 [Fibrobacteria bacterium]|nr:hypothetical protein [Fibrobacteria bacterium]